MGSRAARYALQGRVHRMRVARDSGLAGGSLNAAGLGPGGEACVIAIEKSSRAAKAVLHATPDYVIEPGDILLLEADAATFDLHGFCAAQKLERLPLSEANFSEQAREVGRVAVIIPP